MQPYCTLVCAARSLASWIRSLARLSVRKAARLAVYDEIMMSTKNHHMPATMRVDAALRQAGKPLKEHPGETDKQSTRRSTRNSPNLPLVSEERMTLKITIRPRTFTIK